MSIHHQNLQPSCQRNDIKFVPVNKKSWKILCMVFLQRAKPDLCVCADIGAGCSVSRGIIIPSTLAINFLFLFGLVKIYCVHSIHNVYQLFFIFIRFKQNLRGRKCCIRSYCMCTFGFIIIVTAHDQFNSIKFNSQWRRCLPCVRLNSEHATIRSELVKTYQKQLRQSNATSFKVIL